MKRALLFLLLLLPSCLFARPKSDAIVLVNGNLINGEILSMARAYLSVKTDSIGTVYVKWPDVVRLATTYGFVVEDSEGHRYYGALSSDTDRMLQVADRTGMKTVPMISVISIYPSSLTIWHRFDGSLEAGYTYTKSSTRTQFNLNGDLRYRSLRWESQLDAESLISRANGSTETDRDTASLSALRHLGARWHAYSMFQYQHNLELSLSYRNSVLAGMARRVVQTDRTVFTALAGVAYSRENYTDTTSKNSAEAGLGLRYQFYKLYSPKVDISSQFILSPSLTVSARLRSEFETECKIELIKDFFWSLNFYDSYDSKPPGETDQKQDYGITTGIGWTFG